VAKQLLFMLEAQVQSWDSPRGIFDRKSEIVEIYLDYKSFPIPVHVNFCFVLYFFVLSVIV
jgi:hypothetical protein